MSYSDLNQKEYRIIIARCLRQQELGIETDYFNDTNSLLPATNNQNEQSVQDNYIGFSNPYTI